MWKKPEDPIPIGDHQLCLGVFVWIDRSWKEHPFFYNKFRITSVEQLKQVIALGSTKVYWIPSKSTAEPGPPGKNEVETTTLDDQIDNTNSIKKKNEEVKRQRELGLRAEQDWKKAANLVRESLLGLRDNPKQAGEKLRDLTNSAAHSVSSGEALLHMLGEKEGHGPQHHALNCMTLAMLLAKSMGLPLGAITVVALGALAHDVGCTMIPTYSKGAETNYCRREPV